MSENASVSEQIAKRRAYHREYYAKNKQRLAPSRAASRERRKDRQIAYRANWERSERGKEVLRQSRERNKAKRADYNRRWAAENRERSNQKTYRWRAAHRETVNARQRAKLAAIPEDERRAMKHKYKYGITADSYAAMLAVQGGKCAICCSDGTQYVREGKHVKARLAIDHCHESGKVRGLLCHGCNTALGRFKDSPDILRAAIAYLERNDQCLKLAT